MKNRLKIHLRATVKSHKKPEAKLGQLSAEPGESYPVLSLHLLVLITEPGNDLIQRAKEGTKGRFSFHHPWGAEREQMHCPLRPREKLWDISKFVICILRTESRALPTPMCRALPTLRPGGDSTGTPMCRALPTLRPGRHSTGTPMC